jgi:23S rRNA (guanosine2251-2'-O)-methyltransferase
VVKASAGATEHSKIAQVTNLVREIKNLKDKGFWVFGAEGDAGQNLYSLDFRGENLAFVMGSEGRGMRRLVRESCDHLIAIPMRGKIDSFNASAAAAIIMSEISRQRLLEGPSK